MWALACSPSPDSPGSTPDSTVDSAEPTAALVVSPAAHDFGEVAVGCEETVALTLTSVGEAAVELEWLEVRGDAAFDTKDAPTFPHTLEPLESLAVSVSYTPSGPLAEAAVLALDTSAGPTEVPLSGAGVFEEERSQSWEVGDQSKATVLVHVNEALIPGYKGLFSKRFEAALPDYFQALLDHGAEFRVAFLWDVAGVVHGAHPYIDESFTPQQATDAVLDMIEGGAEDIDNDRAFTTLLAGLERNQDWLFEDETWADSRLSLMSFTNDTEQSGGSATTYGTTARSYKEDASDVVFHAIGGPLPDGCLNAEPFALFKEAVDATGGHFLSVCEEDWSGHMTQLAAGTVVGSEVFTLTGTPYVPSIEVSVDETVQDAGWTFDDDRNAVVFDEESQPARGSTVRIDYLASGSCG